MQTINNLAELCEHYDVPLDESWFRRLNRAVYDQTRCGACVSICFQNAEGREEVFYNGHPDPLPIDLHPCWWQYHTIVEGSEAEFSAPRCYPGILISTITERIAVLENDAEHELEESSMAGDDPSR